MSTTTGTLDLRDMTPVERQVYYYLTAQLHIDAGRNVRTRYARMVTKLLGEGADARALLAAAGLPPNVEGTIASFISTVERRIAEGKQGVDAFPFTGPSPQYIADKREYMRKQLKANPMLADDPDWSDKYQDMIEWSDVVPVDGTASSRVIESTTSSLPAPGADRIAAIRKLNRENPDLYESDKKLQAEYLTLVEAQIAARDVPAGSSEPLAITEGTGGAGPAPTSSAADWPQ